MLGHALARRKLEQVDIQIFALPRPDRSLRGCHPGYGDEIDEIRIITVRSGRRYCQFLAILPLIIITVRPGRRYCQFLAILPLILEKVSPTGRIAAFGFKIIFTNTSLPRSEPGRSRRGCAPSPPTRHPLRGYPAQSAGEKGAGTVQVGALLTHHPESRFRIARYDHVPNAAHVAGLAFHSTPRTEVHNSRISRSERTTTATTAITSSPLALCPHDA